MCDNTADIVHSQTSDGVYDPNVELFPGLEISALAQGSQNSYLSGSHFYWMGPQLILDSEPATSQTGIEAIFDNSRNHNVATHLPASTTSQPLWGPFRPNELAGLYQSEMFEEHYPTFMAPSMPQIELPRTESQPGISSDSIPISPKGLATSPEHTSESHSQVGSQSHYQECCTRWKNVPMDTKVVTGTNKFVPQTLYKPFTEADKERYLERATLSPPIIFETKEPSEWGISLKDAFHGRTHNLVDKDVHVLQDCGPSVSIRINWPGYSSFKRQISSRNWRKMRGPITKGKLAQHLARTTAQFIKKMSNKPPEVGADGSWRVGGRHIKVEDLILVSLHHVSRGSWQPQFRLRRDLST